MFAGMPLHDIWRHVSVHHTILKAFALEHAGGWTLRIRRTAWVGLAVLASMIRRLIHLMALEIRLAPLGVRGERDPFPPSAGAPRRRLGFCLTEAPPQARGRVPGGTLVPDPPELNHAIFLERLAVLVDVYRARLRLARRLARRVQARRAPLRTLPLPARAWAQALPGFRVMLRSLDARFPAPDSS